MVHWPQLGVGAIVCHHGKVLLVRRGQPPSEGLWSIPGGKVQPGEALAVAAEREIREETGLMIRAGKLAYHFEYIERDEQEAVRFHYVVLDLYAEYLGGEPCPGDDAADVRWVGFDELPELALNHSSREALQRLFPQGFSGGTSP